MEYFERAKKRVSIFIWIFLMVVAYLIFSSPGENAVLPIVLGLLFCCVLLNLTLTVPQVRARIGSRTFFMLIIGFSLMSALMFYYGRAKPSSFFIFMLPLVSASMCFQIIEALIMAFIVSLLDITVTGILLPPDSALLTPELISRILFYFLISVLVNHHFAQSTRDLQEKDREVETLRTSLSNLDDSHSRLKDEKAGIEQIKEGLNREVEFREVLFTISRTLTQTLDLQQALSQLLKSLHSYYSFVSGAVFLVDREGNREIFVAASEGEYKSEMERQAQDPSFCMPGIVIQKNQSIVVEDIEQDPRFAAIAAAGKVKSAFYIPLSLENETYGALCLWFNSKRMLSEQIGDLLNTICHETAKAIRNANLYRALDKRLDFMVTLWNASKSLTSVLELPPPQRREVIEKVMATVKVLFRVDSMVFYVYDRGRLIPSILHNLAHEAAIEDLAFSEESIGEYNLLKNPFQVSDITVSSCRTIFQNLIKASDGASFYWYPLAGRERIVGALAFLSPRTREWTKEETQWADIFCTIFSMNLENIALLEDIFSEKNQLEVLVDSMPEGVFTTDSDRRIVTWNKAAAKITGWTSGEVAGKDCRDFIGCSGQEESLCDSECLITASVRDGEKKESYGKTIYIANRDGERIPAYMTVAPVHVTRQKVSGTICVFRDVSREREIEKIKEDFLATITHDLKSPLASIMGYAELMDNPRAGELTKKQREFNDAILRSCKTLQILIDNILMSTRLEAGQMQYNLSDFSVNELFNEIHEMFLPIARHRKIRLIPQENSLTAKADREKIKEVLANLLGNAIKSTPEEGSVMLRGTFEDGRVQVSVSDTGKGIPEDEIPRLFQKFAQARGEKRGTGLGLYIIKKILEDHGQTIQVKSIPGKGSIFTFTLEGKENTLTGS